MVIYFDICAAFIICMIIFSVFYRRMTGGTPNRIFLLLSVICLTTTLFDIMTVVLTRDGGPELATVNYCANVMYLSMRGLTSPVYVLYLISLTDTWHKIKSNNFLKIALSLPYMAVLAMLIINSFTNAVFYIDVYGVYHRAPLMPVLYVCAFLYLIFGFSYLMAYKKLFSTEKFISLMAIFPLTLAAVAVQFIFSDMLVEMFATSIALVLIMVTVQRPEELMDSLTGLGKYDAYAADMKRNFANNKKVGVILINISNYPSMRAILGYDNKNELLRNIAARLTAINKEEKLHGDVYYLDRGRYRFVVSEQGWDKIESAAEKINSEMKQSIVFNRMELNLITYVCIAYCPEEISDFDTLMTFGNELNDLPYSGRVIKTAEIAKENRFRLNSELDAIIDNAVANKLFEVYYQPIYSVQEKRFVSAEALLRLRHEKYGFISPEFFIPAAEKSGAIHKIGELVIEEVCRFISSDEFKNLGLEYIEVNLSVAQCMQSDLADNILRIMEKYNVPPEAINLEITETAASYSQNIMMENLDKLTGAGVAFSLDDYGTGYSNIKSVASLPIKIVKLDKTFVDNESNPRMWTVLKNTIKMLKDMNMHIVVEGIETEGLMKKFADLECEYIQGYYYSRPIPEKDFVDFMRRHGSRR